MYLLDISDVFCASIAHVSVVVLRVQDCAEYTAPGIGSEFDDPSFIVLTETKFSACKFSACHSWQARHVTNSTCATRT